MLLIQQTQDLMLFCLFLNFTNAEIGRGAQLECFRWENALLDFRQGAFPIVFDDPLVPITGSDERLL